MGRPAQGFYIREAKPGLEDSVKPSLANSAASCSDSLGRDPTPELPSRSK